MLGTPNLRSLIVGLSLLVPVGPPAAAAGQAEPPPAPSRAAMDSTLKESRRVDDSIRVARGAQDVPPPRCAVGGSTVLVLYEFGCDSAAAAALVPPGRSTALLEGAGRWFTPERVCGALAERIARPPGAFALAVATMNFSGSPDAYACMDSTGGGWAATQRPTRGGVEIRLRALDRGRWLAPLDSLVLSPRDALLFRTRMGARWWVIAVRAPSMPATTDRGRLNAQIWKLRAEFLAGVQEYHRLHPADREGAWPRTAWGPLPASAGPFAN